MRRAAAFVVFLLVAGCGTETGDPGAGSEEPSDDAPTAMPTAVPVANGPVTTTYAVTVLDDGDGAELCLGGVAESLPPQCGGPKLLGWDWSEHEGDFEEAAGTRWGGFAVTGTFDGRDLTPTHVLPADEFDPPPYQDTDLTSPCPEPEGGWQVIDPETTTVETQDQALRAARRLEGYAGSWVDQSINPAYGSDDPYEMERALNDPKLLVLNVQVTGDTRAAETALREVWGGALCVTRAEHTERELRGIQDEAFELPGALSASSGFDQVEVSVVYDDGSIQAWADREYGAGVVRVFSALEAVGR
jgi:hypothetical protein